MRGIERAAALVTVLGMPVIAYVLARAAVTLARGWDVASLPDADAGVALQAGLTLAAAAVGAAVSTYLAVTGYAIILGTVWRGGRAIPNALAAMAPHGWTKLTATALGLSMSAGLAAPALAAEGASPATPAGWVPAPVSVAEGAAALPSVGWVPATVTTAGWVRPPVLVAVSSDPRPSMAPSVASAVGWVAAPAAPAAPSTEPAAPSAASAASSAYVVQPGDSLWRIAESLLGDGASTADIAAAWPSLYQENREAIGENPSLIHPGLALTIPAGLGS